MEILTYNKQDIIKNIIEFEACIELEKDVLDTIELFKHRKKVDKRFVDALNKKEYHAYITKDKYSTSLRIRKILHDKIIEGFLIPCAEFYLYNSEISSKNFITWQRIIDEFKRHAYCEKLDKYKKMLNDLESEIEEFKKLVEYVESKEFSCFNISSVKRELKYALKHAIKK